MFLVKKNYINSILAFNKDFCLKCGYLIMISVCDQCHKFKIKNTIYPLTSVAILTLPRFYNELIILAIFIRKLLSNL